MKQCCFYKYWKAIYNYLLISWLKVIFCVLFFNSLLMQWQYLNNCAFALHKISKMFYCSAFSNIHLIFSEYETESNNALLLRLKDSNSGICLNFNEMIFLFQKKKSIYILPHEFVHYRICLSICNGICKLPRKSNKMRNWTIRAIIEWGSEYPLGNKCQTKNVPYQVNIRSDRSWIQ